MNTADKSDVNPIMFFDLSAAKTVDVIVLDDVNFNKVKISLALILLKCILIILKLVKDFIWKIIYLNGQAA